MSHERIIQIWYSTRVTFVPLAELPEYVRNVRAILKLLPKKQGATVLWLIGDLGAGKTTFVQSLAREMDIAEEVQSPTYVLMKSYDVPNTRIQNGSRRRFRRLVHIDAYRLANAEEFKALKPEEFLNDPATLVTIEWPEHIAHALPPPDLTVTFQSENVGETERNIEVV